MQKFIAKHHKRLPRNCDSLWSNQLLGIPVRVGNGVVVFYISYRSVSVSSDVFAWIVPDVENIAVVCFFRQISVVKSGVFYIYVAYCSAAHTSDNNPNFVFYLSNPLSERYSALLM